MGMGKTIQAISLVMANRAKTPGHVRSTLVVCPLVAMVQWRGEIERYCAAGSLSLTVYHGAKRVSDANELTKFDVVLTTYAIVQSEFSSLLALLLAQHRQQEIQNAIVVPLSKQ